MLYGLERLIDLALGLGFSLSGSIAYTWGEEEVPDGDDVPAADRSARFISAPESD